MAGCVTGSETPESLMARGVGEVETVKGMSATATKVVEISKRAVENAEAVRLEAEKRVARSVKAGAATRGNIAVEALRSATRDAADAREMASEAGACAARVIETAACVKRLMDQASSVESASEREAMVVKALSLAEACRRETSKALKISEALKRRWLMLEFDTSIIEAGANTTAPVTTTRSNR